MFCVPAWLDCTDFELSSGPKRYDYSPAQDEWVYGRDGRSLNDLLNKELGNVFGEDLDLGLGRISTRAPVETH